MITRKKKIGIVTIVDNENCGNRLQNYALQEVLKKYSFIPETLKNDALLNNHEQFYINFLKYINKKRKELFLNKEKKNNFKKFNKKINFNTKLITCKAHGLARKYDYFICGSDQIWKPTRRRMSYVDLLEFAPSSKRISYAASFGIDKIESKHYHKLENALKKFKSISVREDAGKRIIQQATNINDVEVVIDPTMLLTKEEWKLLEEKPLNIDDRKIILTYFLGEENDKISEKYNKNEYQIVNFSKNENNYGPKEFLYLFDNASLVLTDSFHGCVFSILFETPFHAFTRIENDENNDMTSRLTTLLDKFNLNDRRISSIDEIEVDSQKCDFSHVENILQCERKKSEAFLKKALDIKD